MIENFSPIHRESFSDTSFLTIDGRVGKLFRFGSKKNLISAFTTLRSKYPFLHLQAQDFFGTPLLSISKYAMCPEKSLFSRYFKTSGEETIKSLEYTDRLLEELVAPFDCIQVLKYPEIQADNENRLFKLKYPILWPAEAKEITFAKGFSLIHLPFDEKIRIMYFNRESLKNMLEAGILCIEFVADFKPRAVYFWKPLGTISGLAEMFKL